MNILYLAHRIPYPPTKGDKLRAFRVIDHLSRRHRLWCACFVDHRADNEHVKALSARCHELAAIPLDRRRAVPRALWAWMRGGTITEAFFRHRDMADTITRWGASVSFDVVVAFSSGMAQYVPLAGAKRSVLDLCDLDSRKWDDYADDAGPAGRVLYRAEASRLRLLEQSWIKRCDASVLITEAEARLLDGSTVRNKVHVIGNGVDIRGAAGFSLRGRTARLEPQSKDCADTPRGLKPRGSPMVGFIGQMDYRPNVDAVCWFVEHCWPDIRRRCPNAVFQIVGRCPVRRVRRLANVTGVEVAGEVEDAAEYVSAFDVSVAPLRIARGLQNKVLEAMSAAKPVVLTSAAASGINATDGKHWLIAHGAADMVEDVSSLLCDPYRRIRIGAAARTFVAENHRWQDQLAKFDKVVLAK